MANRKITIEFLGKNSTDKTAAAVERRYGKLGGTLDKVGQRAGKVLAVGFGVAAVAAVKMGQAAAADDAAARKLANTLQNAAHATKGQVAATESWITAQGKSLGVSDDELRPALGRLVVATKDVGKAQELASLAMDVSAGSGKSLDAVTMALSKAQNGNVGALSKLGIATKDAHGKTMSLDQITKNLAGTYKGAASDAADTTAGKQRRLTVAYGELQEKIGAKLLPIMEKVTAVGMKVVDWIDKNQTTAGVLVVVLGSLVTVLWLASVAMRALAVATAINPLGILIIALAALAVGIAIAYKKVGWFKNGVDAYLRAVGAIFTWLWNNAARPALLFIGKALGVVMMVWGKMLQVLGKVPGFGWAKAAGDKMMAAGKQAWNLGDVIKKIPDRNVKIKADTRAALSAISGVAERIRRLEGKTVVIRSVTAKGSTAKVAGYAGGTNFHPGGMALVGEDGPEYLNLPRGSQVFTNRQSVRMAGGGSAGVAIASDTRPILVQLILDGKVLHQSLVKRKRDTGTPLGLA